MRVTSERNGAEQIFRVEGRLDTNTAPELEAKLSGDMSGVEKLIFDFSDLTYISSAGLRVLLSAILMMEGQGSVVIRNASDDVKDVFEVTGFIDELTLEQVPL